MAVRTVDDGAAFRHPLYQVMLEAPGLSVGTAVLDDLLTWGLTNALWIFPMATSCCGIEFMAGMGSRVDLDRMGTIVRGTPRQCDVMVVAGTITTKMAPRVLKLWEQMPEPKWCVAMGSCAISGDFYRNLYSVVPGVDTFLPVDVYVPGCPPNPDALMAGMINLQEKIRRERKGETVTPKLDAALLKNTLPSVPRLNDPARRPEQNVEQERASSQPTLDEATAPLTVAPEAAPELAPLTASDFEGLLKELGVSELPKDGLPVIPLAQHLELARRLKALGYRQLVTIAATHWPAGKGRKGADAAETEHFEIAYALRTVGAGSRVAAWAVRVAPGQPVLTLSGIFAGADWQEREQYDLLGVTFAGHPDLRRLMQAENAAGFPLRRDFASDAPCAPWR
jgi:NADH-quinone oxidoreductase B subunit